MTRYSYQHRAIDRPRVLQRQGNRCLRCKVLNRKIGKVRPRDLLELAHLDGDIQNRSDQNLAALCVACHKRVDYRRWAFKCWQKRCDKNDAARPLLQLLHVQEAS